MNLLMYFLLTIFILEHFTLSMFEGQQGVLELTKSMLVNTKNSKFI